MVEMVQGKLKSIENFFLEKLGLSSGLLSILLLIGWCLFLLGFVFAHGLCCGDDAGLSWVAKNIVENTNSIFWFGRFDPHLGVLIPVILGIRFIGNAYWVPGFSVVIFKLILIIIIGLILKTKVDKYNLVIATFFFFYLNYTLLAKHFEHWYAALGEIPTGLLIILGILLINLLDSWVYKIIAGLSFSVAFLTKMVSFIGFGATLFSLLIQFILTSINVEEDNGYISTNKIFFLSLGFGLPLLTFEGIRHLFLGSESYLNRWLRSFSHIFDVSGFYEPIRIIDSFVQGGDVFHERFGVPFTSLALVMILVGIMVRKSYHLKKIYMILFAIFLFYSLWWFSLSIHWARHYIIVMLLVIFTMTLPILSSVSYKWKVSYFLVIMVWSTISWNNLSIPIEQLHGNYYSPTEKTSSLKYVSGLLTEQLNDEVVITLNGHTISDLRYITDQDIRVSYFRANRNYKTPFWIAVNTKFMHQQDPAFMRLLRNCSGLREYEGYLVGRCE